GRAHRLPARGADFVSKDPDDIGARFHERLRGKTCEAYIVPFDVRLPKGDEADESIDTVVQPDLTVVCELSRLDDRGCRGASDLVVEVVSPSTMKMDLSLKGFSGWPLSPS